jgi:dTDP-4-amino-4,6-dideoxygalactose transaminase
LYAQLEQAETIISYRCKMISLYNELLKPLEDRGFIRLPLLENGSVCNGHMYYIITGSTAERSRLIEYLSNQGIAAVFHYIPLHSSPAGIKHGRVSGSMRVTNDLSGRILRLPLFCQITPEDVEAVVKALTEFYAMISNEG